MCVWVGGILRTCAAIAKNPLNSSTLVCPPAKGMTGGEERSNRFPHRLSCIRGGGWEIAQHLAPLPGRHGYDERYDG